MAMMSIFLKRQVRIDRLGLFQTQMLKVGTVALASIKNRVQKGIHSTGNPSPPLKSIKYAIRKSRLTGRRAIRDLTFTGKLMNNLQIRSVSSSRAIGNLSTRKERIKGKVHQDYFARQTGSSWLAYSQNNADETVQATFKIVTEAFQKLAHY